MDLHHAGVLQVLAGPDGGLCSIRVLLIHLAVHRLAHLAVVVVLTAVEFLEHGLQLGMEKPQHEVLEAHGLDHHPFLLGIGGDVVHVDRLLRAGVRIGALGPDGTDHFIVLVRRGILGGHVTEAVDLGIDHGPLRLIGGVTPLFIQVGDLVQVGTLSGPVQRGDLVCALEKHMFQIVREAGCRARVVFAARAYHDVGLDAWLVLVLRQVHLQPIVQGIDADLHRVVRNGCVGVLLLRVGGEGQCCAKQREGQRSKFHLWVDRVG